MEVDKMDMSLDAIIEMKKNLSPGQVAKKFSNKKSGGGLGKPVSSGGRRQQGQGDLSHRMGRGWAGPPSTAISSKKLLVSNLGEGVSDEDVEELFSEYGPLSYSALHHDNRGISLGTADVIFQHKEAAVRALKQLHGVALDGKPMNIQFAVNDLSAPAASTAGSGFPSPPIQAQSKGNGGGRVKKRGPQQRNQRSSNSSSSPFSSGRRNRSKEVEPSASELDKEIDEYMATKMDV